MAGPAVRSSNLQFFLDRADQALAGLLDQERAILAELSPSRRGDLASLLRQLTAPFDNIPG